MSTRNWSVIRSMSGIANSPARRHLTKSSSRRGKGWCIFRAAYRARVKSEDGGLPSNRYDEETDGYVDIDLAKELAEHLAEGQVAILMECGAEKLRYHRIRHGGLLDRRNGSDLAG